MKVFICLLALAASASAGFLGGLAPHGLVSHGVASHGLAAHGLAPHGLVAHGHGGVIAGANGLHTITIQEESPALLQAQPSYIQAQPSYIQAQPQALVQEAPAAQAIQFAAAPAPAHAVQYLSAGAPAHSVVQSAGSSGFSFLQGGAPAGYEFLSGAAGSVGSAVNVLPHAAHSVGVAPSVQVIQAAPAPAYNTIQVAQPEYKTIQVAQPEYKTIQLVQEAFPAEHHKTFIQGGHHEHAKFLQYLKK